MAANGQQCFHLKNEKEWKIKNIYTHDIMETKAVVSSFGPASIINRTAFWKTLPQIIDSSL